MSERLLNKNEIPTTEGFLSHIGQAKELYADIDVFLIDDIKAQNMIKFDAHSSCWKMSYHVKRKYICDIIAEKDAFTIVTRLSGEDIEKIYEEVTTYSKKYIDNSPYRHRGWIEHRVLESEHLESAKIILQARANCKL